jgi:hypothetical protein
MGEGTSEERWGGRDEWRDREHGRGGGDWRGREEWRGGERDDWRGGGREEWRGGDWRGREGWRGGGREEWRGRDWRGGQEGERRPEIDPPWVEPGPEWRRRHRDTRGLVEWEDRGPLAWLGDKFREATGRRGRGPKGYQRSDDRIHDEVCERIARSGIDADEVEVTVKDREVTLSGNVRRRIDKWRLEEVADDVFGVEDVHNGLRVRHASETGPGAEMADPRH